MTLPTAAEAHVTRLSNGFRVATERMANVASACIGVWIEAGARHEGEAENGIAHFLEHMAFKGTERRTAQAIAEEIEDVGGHLNAYTSRERTAYYARVMAEDVPRALEILADILRGSVLDPEEMELERGVILSEIGQAHDTPDDIIFDWLHETAYPGQAFGRPILGPAKGVQGYRPEDLRRFIARHYSPERMILAASGAVDHEAMVAQAERLFGDMPAGAAPEEAEARFSGGEHRAVKKLEQAHFALALAAPAYRDPGYYAAQLAATALGGGMSSRLFQEARERRGLCYTIFAHASAWADTGLYTIYAGTSGDALPELMRLTADELRAAAEGLTEAEVARARAQTRAGLLMGVEGVSVRAERLAACVALWGRPVPVAETVERIEAVRVEDARAAIRAALAAAPALALYGPVAKAEDAASFADRLAA
ncbi:MAG: pitrilysin family protein [Pseudomonadota bacterium]